MKIFISLMLVAIAINLQAQKEKKRAFDEEVLPVRNELYIGGGINTLGFQVNIAYGWLPNPVRTMSFFADFGEIKHPKEKLQTYDGLSIIGGAPKSFIYGKQNNLFFFRLGYGEKLYLSDKNKRAVSVGFSYGGGFSLGMVRPYYLDLIYRDIGGRPTIIAERFNETNIPKFLNPQEVDGTSNPSLGWSELTMAPGLFLKAALLVDWGAFSGILKDVEIGIAADFYFQKIPLLIFEESSPIFVNLYLNIHLGHRW